jgi:pyruvate,orthophosphate dikinase
VVARALGRPCVVGCGADSLQSLTGRRVTVDGSAGIVYDGELEMQVRREESEPCLSKLLEWSVERSPIRVLTAAPPEAIVIDLDLTANLDEPDAVTRALSSLQPGACVRGAIFSSNDDAVRAAMRAGAGIIVTYPRLPALLVAVQSQPPLN